MAGYRDSLYSKEKEKQKKEVATRWVAALYLTSP
jgi:hypothetical protein